MRQTNTPSKINTSLKTLAIKARVYNYIRTELYKKKLDSFSDKQKIDFFNTIFLQNKEAHHELNEFKAKRKYKANIQKLREEKKLKKNLVNPI